MIPRRTRVTLGFALLGVVAGFGVDAFMPVSDWVAVAVVLLVGFVVPRLYLRYTGSDSAD